MKESCIEKYQFINEEDERSIRILDRTREWIHPIIFRN